MRAAEGGNMDIVKYLVEECKCDPNEKDREYGITALMRATTCRRHGVVNYLLEKKASVRFRDKGGRNKWGDSVLDIKTVDPAVKTYLRSRLKAK